MPHTDFRDPHTCRPRKNLILADPLPLHKPLHFPLRDRPPIDRHFALFALFHLTLQLFPDREAHFFIFEIFVKLPLCDLEFELLLPGTVSVIRVRGKQRLEMRIEYSRCFKPVFHSHYRLDFS